MSASECGAAKKPELILALGGITGEALWLDGMKAQMLAQIYILYHHFSYPRMYFVCTKSILNLFSGGRCPCPRFGLVKWAARSVAERELFHVNF